MKNKLSCCSYRVHVARPGLFAHRIKDLQFNFFFNVFARGKAVLQDVNHIAFPLAFITLCTLKSINLAGLN